MGLVARQIEAAGISTVSLTSARDITAAANPPRSAFVDFPLGHTAGKADEPELNARIVAAALEVLSSTEPGVIVDLPFQWSVDDAWKDDVMKVTESPTGELTAEDDRRERFPDPQYQTEADRDAARLTHAAQPDAVVQGIDY